MTFEALTTAFCRRFLARRTMELIVAPALADLEFEDAAGRRSRVANRAAVLRAVAGGVLKDARGSSFLFLKLTLMTLSYFYFPVMMGLQIFKSWTEVIVAAGFMLLLSMTPVIICFWPERRSEALGD